MNLPIKPLDKNFTLGRIVEYRELWDSRDSLLNKELFTETHLKALNEKINQSGYNLQAIVPQSESFDGTRYELSSLTPRQTDTKIQKVIDFIAGPKKDCIYSTSSKTDMKKFLQTHFSEELKNDSLLDISNKKSHKPF
jgi:hypothetical protein